MKHIIEIEDAQAYLCRNTGRLCPRIVTNDERPIAGSCYAERDESRCPTIDGQVITIRDVES